MKHYGNNPTITLFNYLERQMKKLLVTAFAVLLALPVHARSSSHANYHNSETSLSSVGPATTGGSSKITHVQGYTKHNGVHVDGYDRTGKDGSKANNWSTKGNINPETGKPGTK